ncbi:MAG: PIN domain-containing protein [Cryomorphaceae bacterium]|nr:PIN domain-containing protein [Cryomorphaceae bacterium]
MGKRIDVLIDTDVILDLLLDRSDYSDDAAKLFTLCERGEINGYVTPIIFANMFYFLKKVAGSEQAVLKSLALLNFLEVIPVTKPNIKEALFSPMADKEDAMQSMAAYSHGRIHAIVTRNVKGYKKSPLQAVLPGDVL